MKHITSNGRHWIWVGVPEDVFGVNVLDGRINVDSVSKGFYIIPLPPGTYRLHAVLSTITDEQAGEVVEQWMEIIDERGYRDFSKPYISFGCKNRTDSLRSLMKAHGLNEQNYVILEKIEA